MTEEKAMVSWEDELAKLAEAAAKQEAGVGGGQYFSAENGILSFNGEAIPGSRVAVVIVDSVLANVFYTEAYDPDTKSPPACYAFGRSDEEMAPHPEATSPQAKTCDVCPHNQWGSAERGRGKECNNRRRVAVLAAGNIVDGKFEEYTDAVAYARGQMAFINLSPTAIKPYATYVKQMAGVFKRPPLALYTMISTAPDKKTKTAWTFEHLGLVPKEMIEAVMMRRAEAASQLTAPFAKAKAEEDKKPRAKRKY